MTRHISAPQQEALWWIQQRSPRKDLCNLTWRMSVGAVDPHALGRAWQAITDRYEALRTALVQQDGTVWQEIHEGVEVTLNEMTWPQSAQESLPAGRDLLDDLATHLHRRPFDLETAPLARLSLVSVGERSELLLTVHHTVLDGWSLQRLMTELAEAYHAELAETGSAVSVFGAEPVQFAEYAMQARRAQQDGRWKESIDFWVNTLSRAESVTVVPDRTQPAEALGAPGAVLRYPLSARAATGVAALTKRGGMTPFAAYLAAMHTVFGRGGASGRLAIGVAVANRFDERDDACVGYLTNLVVTTCELRAGDTLDNVVFRARDDFWDSLPYQQVPFSLVHNALPLADRERLGDMPAVLLTYHGRIGTGVLLGDRQTRLKASPSTSATNHFAVGIFEESDRTVFEVEYDATRFEESTVVTLLSDLEHVLESGVDEGTPVDSLIVRSKTIAAHLVAVPAVETAPATFAGDSELDQTVTEIWRRTLRAPESKADSDFFALGGHSLQVFGLFAEVQEATGGQLDIMDWLDTPTLGKLIELARQSLGQSASDNVLLRAGTECGPHLHLIHPAGDADHATYKDLAAALPDSWKVTISPDEELETILEMADAYLADLQEDGLPNVLGGWSLGGLIAYAMALRLRQQGATPPPLLLIDPPAPDGSSFDEGHSELDSFIFTILRAVNAPALIPSELRLDPRDTEHSLGVLEALLDAFGSPLPIDALRRRFEAIKRHWTAMSRYVSSEPINVPAIVVSAELTEEDTEQWRALLGHGMVVLSVDTDHYAAAKAPYAGEIAEKIVELAVDALFDVKRVDESHHELCPVRVVHGMSSGDSE